MYLFLLYSSNFLHPDDESLKMETTILIENDPVLNYVNKRVLQLIGFKGDIHLFSNALEASVFLDQYFRELTEDPERLVKTMIFLDDDLPDIDAMDLLEKLDGLNPDLRSRVVPVLMVSGHLCDQNCSCQKQRQGLEVVMKPLLGSVLKKLIRDRFGKTMHRARKDVFTKTKDFLKFGDN